MAKSANHNRTLLDFLSFEFNYPFKGWDFSHITRTGRMVDGPLTWSYGSLVLERLRTSRAMLDIGTGGGELLASLGSFPRLAFATESFGPNFKLAKARLEPLGVKVVRTDEDASLPFPDRNFDLVTDRHESYNPSEVIRILKSGGWFITQQVGDRNDLGIRKLLVAGRSRHSRWNLQRAVGQLKKAGFQIAIQKEEFPRRRFYDVGAVVYYLKAVPWVIPDFTVKRYSAALVGLKDEVDKKGFIEDLTHRFIVMAHKPR